MKKIIMIALLLCLSMTAFSQYENYTEFNDTITIRTNNCCLYKTAETKYIYDTGSYIINIPKDVVIITNYFDGIFYKIKYENCIGYIFCMDVITPERILKIQELIISGQYTEAVKDSINEQYKMNPIDVENYIEEEIINQNTIDEIIITTDIVNKGSLDPDIMFFLYSFLNMYMIGF
jgi:hypothetical protein